MAYSKLSTENKLEEFLRAEDTTTTFIAALASIRGLRGLSQTRLSQVQRGKPLEHDAAVGLHQLLVAMEELRDRLKPVPVRFHNAQDINALLIAMVTGSLFIIAVDGLGDRQ